MKRVFWAGLIAVAAVAIMVGCGQNPGSLTGTTAGGDGYGTIAEGEFGEAPIGDTGGTGGIPAALVGTWELHSQSVDGVVYPVTVDVAITINSNGTGSINEDGDVTAFTISVTGNGFSITIGVDTMHGTYALSDGDTTLALTFTEDGLTMVQVFWKV